MSGEQKETKAVSPDTLYSQLAAELRWHRDRELSVAVWFTSILLVFLGAVVAWKYAAPGYPLGVALERCSSLKSCLAVVPVLLGAYGAWSIAEAMRSCGLLRRRMTDTLGTTPDTPAVDSVFRPGTLMCVLLVFLGIFSAILIIHRPSVLH
jgi:hypothetical protein